MNASTVLLASVLVVGALHTTGCCNSRNVDAAPECPAGREVSATLTVMGDLDGIRSIDGDSEIEVRGTRDATDACVEEGALSAFSVRLRSDLGETQTFDNLAPGAWTIIVTALSGGEHREHRQSIVLAAGSSSLFVARSSRQWGS